MANNLRVFNTNSEYQSADLVHPGVSYVIETDKVIYEPTTPTPSFKWKSTYQDSHVESAQCDSSSEITEGEINLTNLVSVEIGDCVTSIDDNAFQNCSSLTSIDIPSGVTSIGWMAFYYCESLTSVTIGSGVTFIANGAFRQCTSLTSVTVNATTPPTLGIVAFPNCSIFVPAESVNAYKTAAKWSNYASRIYPIP